jgi:hypothetical protein
MRTGVEDWLKSDGKPVEPSSALIPLPLPIPTPVPVAPAVENPKERFGAAKPGIQFIPPIALIEEAMVMAAGAAEHGAFNWNDTPIRLATYYSAIFRHLGAWFAGEELDQKSGFPHMAHVRANTGIILDAMATGSYIDDRPKKTGDVSAALARLAKPVTI